MPSIQVKDVPDEVHATLRRRASAAGKSLQEYLLERLTADASRPTLDEVLDRAGGRAGGRATFEDAAAAVRAGRDAAVIVVDVSVIVSALADDGFDGDQARDRLRGEDLVAPHLLDVEVVSAWRRLADAGNLDDRRAALAIVDLRDLRIERVAHESLMPRCWELRHSLTAYDAVYVALAEAIDAVLITEDARLAGSNGPRCTVELIA